jgi:hypothetical protein
MACSEQSNGKEKFPSDDWHSQQIRRQVTQDRILGQILQERVVVAKLVEAGKREQHR